MKNLLAISKKGIIFIFAAIMITAGVLIAVLPNSSDGCGGGGMGSYTKYVTIPTLNNTGQTLTISKMYVKVPGECSTQCGKEENETRVKEIRFSDDNTFGDADDIVVFSTSSGECCCSKTGCNGKQHSFNMNDNKYDLSGAKVWCRITLRRDHNSRPTGTYTVTYYFGFPGEATDARNNTETFNL
ncbi:MAG: hypothetical protein KJ550_05475 [Proteobacteria bacterium]|nr:hypothetical protein [Desulfobacteraceae bacterium]MBU4012898.1 hypothetical protein [Pseudomonadota bacterium]MBU4100974.1 hypothetical protein [Pseudomonadota bacterium]MBU4128202.1 hypothetical protein [Pseudomonadota bacterium]